MTELTSDNCIVIIGGGQAGGACAMELRKLGFEGRVVIVTEEDHIPYKRPPLSKAYLAGEAALETLYVMQPARLEAANIECMTGVKVETIDREVKHVSLSNGETIDYDKLLIATGSRARELPVEGADGENVFPLRSIADVDAIRAECAPGKKMVIIGGGFIGLEVAAIGRKLEMDVTVLEGMDRVLARVTSEQTSAFFEKVHREAGVDLHTGASVHGLEGSPRVTHVVLGDDSKIEADVVVIGIGIVPNVELALAAGLDEDNGIVVNEYTQTSDPDIYAAGDCSNHPNPLYGCNLRLESVQNAMDQARCAAANMLGTPTQYDALPWFWSDQYDLKLQMVGLSKGYDDVVIRGNPDDRNFSAFYLKNGKLIAVDSVSRPKDFMMAKKLVAEGIHPDKTALADESVELKSLLPA